MRHSKYLKILVFIGIIGFVLSLSLTTHAGVPHKGTLGITQDSDAGGKTLTQKQFVKLKKQVHNIKNLLLHRGSNIKLVVKMFEKLFRACSKLEIPSNIDKCHVAARKAEMQIKSGIESSNTDIKAAIDIMINEMITPFDSWADEAAAVLKAREKYFREHPEIRP